jgi:DNA-binding NtrC family response regulator
MILVSKPWRRITRRGEVSGEKRANPVQKEVTLTAQGFARLPAEGSAMRYSGSRVIIVDDEKGIRDLLQDNLEEEGYICYTAASGEEALTVLAGQAVELALIDIMMPGMPGVYLFGYIKELYPDLAVIFVTAVEDANLGVEVLKAGASDYIIKPVTRKRLLEAAQDALGRREAALEESRRRKEQEELIGNQAKSLENRDREVRALNQMIQTSLEEQPDAGSGPAGG